MELGQQGVQYVLDVEHVLHTRRQWSIGVCTAGILRTACSAFICSEGVAWAPAIQSCLSLMSKIALWLLTTEHSEVSALFVLTHKYRR